MGSAAFPGQKQAQTKHRAVLTRERKYRAMQTAPRHSRRRVHIRRGTRLCEGTRRLCLTTHTLLFIYEKAWSDNFNSAANVKC